MNYKELRAVLRARGFINHEIAVIHHEYLIAKAMDVTDDEILFDRQHGLLLNAAGAEKYKNNVGKQVAVSTADDKAFVVP